MRFALLGEHADGLDMTRALTATGRHQLLVYSGPPDGEQLLRRWGLTCPRVVDLEEVLANPAIDLVIVASSLAARPAHTRRALQAERHVLCVHPLAPTPEAAYEASMLHADSRLVLLPLLPEAQHPAFALLAERVRQARQAHGAEGLLLLQGERWFSEALQADASDASHKLGVPGWDVLRQIAGDLAEIGAFAAADEWDGREPLLLTGRFERGGLLQMALLPRQPEARWRLTLRLREELLELSFPQGCPGPAQLLAHTPDGSTELASWASWNPWPSLVACFEAALGDVSAVQRRAPAWSSAAAPEGIVDLRHAPAPSGTAIVEALAGAGSVTWQDEVRCLELDDAARRSVEKRRFSALDYQEATEEANFKGTMTLVGCSMIWVSLGLLILSRWLPWAGWLIAPFFGFFLLLQLLRWVVPPRPEN